MEANNNRRNIFLLESPFQILCANEMVPAIGLENNLFIIKPSKIKKNNKQLKELAEYLPHIKRKVYLPSLNSVFISDVILLFVLRILRVKRVNYLVIGEATSHIALSFVNNIRYAHCFALDDGFSTVNVQKQIEKEGVDLYNITHETSSRRKRFKALIKLLFLKRTPINSIDWFTCFDIVPVDGQKIYLNRFEVVKSLIKSSVEVGKDIVYYLGGPYSKAGILSLENELKYIGAFSSYLLSINKRMVYCVHRRETKLKLEAVAKIVGENNMRYAQYPIEVDFLFASEKPSELASIVSTALVTLNKIYKVEKTYIIDIAQNDLLRERTDAIYAYLRANLNNLIIFDEMKAE